MAPLGCKLQLSENVFSWLKMAKDDADDAGSDLLVIMLSEFFSEINAECDFCLLLNLRRLFEQLTLLGRLSLLKYQMLKSSGQ